MRVIHIMQDGTIRNSVEGVVIRDKRFYQIFNSIQTKHITKGKKENEKIY